MCAYVPPHLRGGGAKKPGSSRTQRRRLEELEERKRGEGSYVSAYEAQRTGEFGRGLTEEDESRQVAKLVEFSRYRREALGQRRREGQEPQQRRQSAPRAFGTNDHGRGLEAEEDVAGGGRVDAAGMVYAMEDGSCVYFCDRFRRYKFFCGPRGLGLLRDLVAVNDRMLGANAELFSEDPKLAAAQRAEGYALYEEKPNLRRRGAEIGTWSDREYSLPGFQYFYLRLKSFQRFCESWALLERCEAAGLFDLVPLDRPLAVVSLGGGPGYELLATDRFARAILGRPAPALALASFDLQPSWKRYVDVLGYDFARWDVKAPDAARRVLEAYPDGRPLVLFLSNILCYCTDDHTADLFAHLLRPGARVRAVVANERGAVQNIVGMLERRGLVVVKLLDQLNAGRDDRQLIFLPPGSPDTFPNLPLPDDHPRVFPNQPYEEKKGVRRSL